MSLSRFAMLRNKRWKWLLGSGLGLVLVSLLFIFFWLNPLLEQSLIRAVPYLSENLYQVQSVQVSYDFVSSSFLVRDLRLHSHPARGGGRPVEETFSLRALSIPLLRFSGLNWLHLLRYRQISARSIQLESPELRFHGDMPEADRDSLAIPAAWYEPLTATFRAIRVSDIHIDRARVFVDPADSTQAADSLTQFSLHVAGLETDSAAANPLRLPFTATGIQLDIDLSERRLTLADSLHYLEAAGLHVYTYREKLEADSNHYISDLRLDGLRLLPLYSRRLAAGEPLLAELNLPELRIFRLNPYRSLKGERLWCDSLTLYSPALYLSLNTEVAAGGKPDTEGWFAAFMQYLHSPQLRVEGGSLQLAIRQAAQRQEWETDDLSLLWRRSEGAGSHTARFLAGLELRLGESRLRLPASGQRMQIDAIEFEGNLRRLALRQLNLMPEGRGHMAHRFHLAAASAEGIPLQAPSVGQPITLSELVLQQPELVLQGGTTPGTFGFAGDSMALPFRIGHLDIREGALRYGSNGGGTSFRGRNWYLSLYDVQALADTLPLTFRKIDAAGLLEQLRIPLPDSSFTVEANRVWLSTYRDSLAADSLRLRPETPAAARRALQDLRIPGLRLRGLYLDSLLKHRSLRFDSLRLHRPLLHVSEHVASGEGQTRFEWDWYAKIAAQLYRLSLPYVTLDSATLVRAASEDAPADSLRDISLVLRDFRLDSGAVLSPQRMLYAEDVALQLGSFTVPLADSAYHLQVGGARYSTAGRELALDQLQLLPAGATNDSLIDWQMARLSAEGVDLYEILLERQARVNRLRLQQPELRFSMSALPDSAARDSLQRADLYPFIAEYVDALQIDELRTEGGYVQLIPATLHGPPLELRDILFSIQSIHLDSTTFAQTANPLQIGAINLALDVAGYTAALPDSSYTFSCQDIHLSTDDSLLVLEKVEVAPLKGTSRLGALLNLQLERLQLEGLDFTELYRDHLLRFQALRFIHPEIYLEKLQPQDRTAVVPGFTPRRWVRQDPYTSIAPFLRQLFIHTISLEEASLQLKEPGAEPFTLNNFTFRAYDFSIDSTAFARLDEGYLFARDFDLTIRDYRFPLPDSSMYELETRAMGLSTRQRSAFMDSLQLIPKYGRDSFARRKGYVIDRFTFQNHKLEIQGLDIEALLQNRQLYARHLHLLRPSLEVYKDKRLPFPEDKRPPMPIEGLIRLPLQFRIDTLFVTQARIAYEETNPPAPENAFFLLDELNIDAFRLTNDPYTISQGGSTVVQAMGYVMGEAPMEIELRFPLADTAGRHIVQGRVGQLDTRALNPLIEHAAFIRATSGVIDSIFFRFRADRRSSWGRMRMRYHDLKIELISKKKEEKKDKVGTALANAFVVKKDNPRNRFLRVGRISFERELQKGAVTYWVKSIVSGLKSSIGINRKDDRFRLAVPPD